MLGACGSGPEKTGEPIRKGTGLREVVYAEDHPDQYGVLGIPDSDPVGIAVLVHGGFWLAEYGAGLMDAMASDLRERGWATWNVEYRRVGDGGGFPATFEDVAAAFDKVPTLGLGSDLPVVSIGHSAGGHLAVWAASRNAKTPGGSPRWTPDRTISLSGVLDLTSAVDQDLGGGAAIGLMGTTPTETAASYALADPCELVPARGTVLAVHAEDDDIVPADQSSTYVTLDTAAGGDARLVTVPGGHFDLIDPRSDAWREVLKLL